MKQKKLFDEEIIDMINRVAQTTNDSVPDSSKDKEKMEYRMENGIKILGKWIYFERRLLAGDTIRMMLPREFLPMSRENARIKYPSEHRPETILLIF